MCYNWSIHWFIWSVYYLLISHSIFLCWIAGRWHSCFYSNSRPLFLFRKGLSCYRYPLQLYRILIFFQYHSYLNNRVMEISSYHKVLNFMDYETEMSSDVWLKYDKAEIMSTRESLFLLQMTLWNICYSHKVGNVDWKKKLYMK